MFVTIAPTAVVLYCVCLFNLSSLVPISNQGFSRSPGPRRGGGGEVEKETLITTVEAG